MADETHAWWIDRPMDVGEARRWVLGPSTIWIERRPSEWVVSQQVEGDPLSETLEVAAACAPGEPLERGATPLRFAGIGAGSGGLRLRPRLADRAVVSLPEQPFSVLPGEEVTAHVGSPIWLGLELLPGPRQVIELPLLRASDTWFGPNTREGELCFASRTRCRLRLEDVRFTPHRAVTAVTLRNAGDTPLEIERIYVPVPALSLWAHVGSESLWTSSIVYTREADDDELARIDIREEAPPGAERLADPRRPESRGLVRAFSRLL